MVAEVMTAAEASLEGRLVVEGKLVAEASLEGRLVAEARLMANLRLKATRLPGSHDLYPRPYFTRYE